MADRIVHTRWTGGMRAVTQAGTSRSSSTSRRAAGGTDTGPQPTDLLLASVGSCIALSMAFVARKRGIELLGLDVRAVGSYDGLKFDQISVSITSGSPRSVVEDCYQKRTSLLRVKHTAAPA